jgi:hypothetical protein
MGYFRFAAMFSVNRPKINSLFNAQTQTNIFVVSIAQEERIDQLSYELAIDKNCKVSLVKKEESVIRFSR